ncbi:pyruvate formate lyase activating enzyme [Lachnospiraceae bacterium]|nr:pyruvate formate lyase activating enzyme [Lachnospiraceae bacterium]
MIIHGFNKTTLLDYPGKLACSVFTGNCNFRCVFCQNASLVLEPENEPVISDREVLDIIEKRKNILQGVCISGGEPTLDPGLRDFIIKVREIGLPVKLDTNGYMPDVLEGLLRDGLLDMVAMDIKSDLEGYAEIAGLDHFDRERVQKSVDIIINSGVEYEFRTTVVKEYFTEKTAVGIGEWLNGAKALYLQAFRDSDDVMVQGLHGYDSEDLLRFRDILRRYIEKVEIRGTDAG